MMQKSSLFVLLILFFVGIITTVAGAMFRVLHWPGGNLLLFVGMTLEAVAVVLMICKLIDGRNNNI
jgi:hypothetical protein